jgi:hypothetical protein
MRASGVVCVSSRTFGRITIFQFRTYRFLFSSHNFHSSHIGLGPVKLAIRDREYLDHRVYFVKVTEDALLEEAWPSPEFAVIPSDNCLEIFVEQVVFDFDLIRCSPTFITGRRHLFSRQSGVGHPNRIPEQSGLEPNDVQCQ